MDNQIPQPWSRREFLGRLTGVAVVGLVGLHPEHAAAEPPPETMRLRLPRYPYDVACTAPQWVAEELLRTEGFANVEYVGTREAVDGLEAGELDLALAAAPGLVLNVDAGKPIVVLAGVHAGCFELFGTDRVRSIRDLRGKTVAVSSVARRAFVASMAAYVGLNAQKDISFVSPSAEEAMRLSCRWEG